MDDGGLLDGVRRGDRRALARAITLVESTGEADRAAAEALLATARPRGQSLRLGVTGSPGAGKSTLIEALGLRAIALGARVAVLAIDPSSSVTGGSILGDKTRMEQLAASDQAFIRPSPSSGTLGGVASGTRAAIALCEAAGYDTVIVETVGVGQSEAAVADLTDLTLFVQLPNAGDQLQAIKRGVLEAVDVVAVNKTDLDAPAAERAAHELGASLGHDVAIHRVSALTGDGLDALWSSVTTLAGERRAAGVLQARRAAQLRSATWRAVERALIAGFRGDAHAMSLLQAAEREVEAGTLTPEAAARRLVRRRPMS